MSQNSQSPGLNNRLLAALPANDYQRILPLLEAVSLELRDMLYEPNQTIEYVYFPTSGMASILVDLRENIFVEAGVVGNEGMVGLPVYLGAEKTITKAFYQVVGEAVRMRSDAFRTEIQCNGAFAPIIQRYIQAYMTMLAQNSACNSQHSINQRCARWLLTVRDRVGKDQFELTQEFLSQMLGIRRAGVSEVMGMLQNAGHIHYSRGAITLIDRAGLESSACECYGVVADEYKRLLG